MRLFYDTETSGLWRDDVPFDHPSQPNMVQLAAQLFDAKWNRTGSFVFLIKPAGWSIEPEAERHHGISEQRCARHGVPLVVALAALQSLAGNARLVAAHHNEFDRKVVRSELARAGADGLWWERKGPQFFCTMEHSTDVCQLPSPFPGFKFPSLEEAHRHFYPELDYSTQHDAEADTDALVRVFRALEQIGRTPSLTPGIRQ